MATTNVIQVNAYEIDGQPLKTASAQLFPAESQVLPYFGTNPNLYAVIIGATDNRHYAVVETVATLKSLMDA